VGLNSDSADGNAPCKGEGEFHRRGSVSGKKMKNIIIRRRTIPRLSRVEAGSKERSAKTGGGQPLKKTTCQENIKDSDTKNGRRMKEKGKGRGRSSGWKGGTWDANQFGGAV